MSVLQLRQIENKIKSELYESIDMSDQNARSSTFEDIRRSRALAAYVIKHFTHVDEKTAGASVVDGSNDNGLDSVYFHEPEETLYLVQSKWIKDGKGEPDNGSVKNSSPASAI